MERSTEIGKKVKHSLLKTILREVRRPSARPASSETITQKIISVQSR